MAKLGSLSLLLGLLTAPAYSQPYDNMSKFLECGQEVYYSSLFNKTNSTLEWTREDLHSLVENKHRSILPENSGSWGTDDIHRAIMDLDRGEPAGSITLIYRDISIHAIQEINAWEIERLWPLESNTSSLAAFSDVHHLRPIDVKVLKEKKAANYGMCNTVSPISACTTPATDNTGLDTAQDDKVWQPPQSKRGEIARALLYMDLRYNELTLQDCAPSNGTLGYLSQLLQWHIEYPPNEDEKTRNDRACSRWQGNRNPFVDFPELAETIFGAPQLLTSSRSYPGCIDTSELLPTATDAVATNLAGDPCSSIEVGSLPVFLVNSMDPDEVVFLALDKIAGGIELYLTDQAWNGEELIRGQRDDGTVLVSTDNAFESFYHIVLTYSLSAHWLDENA